MGQLFQFNLAVMVLGPSLHSERGWVANAGWVKAARKKGRLRGAGHEFGHLVELRNAPALSITRWG